MAADNTTSLSGAVQKYFTRKLMSLPRRSFDTPLANNSNGVTATIPKNNGQFIEFRYFENFSPTVTSASDSGPLTYDQSTEPSSGETFSATVLQAPLDEISHYISLGHFLVDTDPTELLSLAFDEFTTLVKRYVHRLTNDSFVNQPVDKNSFATGTIPSPFKTIYAGNGYEGTYADLRESSYVTMNDFKIARSAMENGRVPKINGMYNAVISDAVKNQLMDDSKDFRDIVKRHGNLTSESFQNANLPTFEGFRWALQDDEYRSNLPEASGTAAARVDAGRVHWSHVFGKNAFGYVDLAGKSRLKPKMKIQDITKTGIETTIGFRIPFKSHTLIRRHGLNIAGTTRYHTDIDSI